MTPLMSIRHLEPGADAEFQESGNGRWYSYASQIEAFRGGNDPPQIILKLHKARDGFVEGMIDGGAGTVSESVFAFAAPPNWRE